MKTIEWKCIRGESKLLTAIAKRATKESPDLVPDFLELEMDLTACHLNGCRLDLQKLLDAPPGEFGHDVVGIQRFIDRETGELGGCFLPRSAA